MVRHFVQSHARVVPLYIKLALRFLLETTRIVLWVATGTCLSLRLLRKLRQTTMTPYQARAIRDMKPELTTYVNADDITGLLLCEKAISTHDLERINNCRTRYDKMAMLLNIILHPDSPPGRSPYQTFLNALGEKSLILAQQTALKYQQYREDRGTVAVMKGACWESDISCSCDVTHDERKKFSLQSDHQEQVTKVISVTPSITGRELEPEESEEDSDSAMNRDEYTISPNAMVPINKGQVWCNTHPNRHDDVQISLPATLSSSVDFPSRKMARFVYRLQRQMVDSLDHCAWDQLDKCAQRVRAMFPHDPQVLAIVHMFLGLRERWQGNSDKYRASSREVLHSYPLGPTVSIVIQGMRIMSCFRLCCDDPEARQEGLIAIQEGRQTAHFLPPCPEKARFIMFSAMLLGRLYNHIPEYQNEATRQQVIHLFQESFRLYSVYKGPEKNLGMPRALIQLVTFLVECRLGEKGNLIPQNISNDDRARAKLAFQRVAELESDAPPSRACRVGRLIAEVDYHIDIGAYERAQDLAEKLEKMTADSGLSKIFGGHIVESRKKFLRYKIMKQDLRERSDALLAEAAVVTTL